MIQGAWGQGPKSRNVHSARTSNKNPSTTSKGYSERLNPSVTRTRHHTRAVTSVQSAVDTHACVRIQSADNNL